ncbi:MAG TPA: 2'-5' RNA ligase family protein, partial [Actinomycetota bacterium]|nr:2'-5' RNA ligase family protein [Actinomycetota bacterium]
YWALSPNVMNHTPDCVALAGKFWPWPVIEAVGPPPRHHGCACSLYTLDEAVERDWMDTDQANVDVHDALRRAKQLLKDAETITESVSQEEFEMWVRELTEGADNGGAMIALYPSADVARKLCVPDGDPPHRLHVTLKFLGADHSELSSAMKEKLKTAVSEFAAAEDPLEGAIDGAGTFPGHPDHKEGEKPIFANVKSAGIQGFRRRLVDHLPDGVIEDTHADFKPHMTLKYAPANADPDLPDVQKTPVRFDHVVLKFGDTAHRFELGTGRLKEALVEASAGPRWNVMDAEGDRVAVITVDPPSVDSTLEDVAAWATHGAPALRGEIKNGVAREVPYTVPPDDPMWSLAVLSELDRRGWYIASDLGEGLEEGVARGHHPRVYLRYRAGFERGGQFMPLQGGNPGRHLADAAKRALLKTLMPEMPVSPREQQLRGDGVQADIEGRRLFVPVARAFDRVVNGHRYTSPAGSPHIYQDGKPFTGQRSPGVAPAVFDAATFQAELKKTLKAKPKKPTSKTPIPATEAAAAAAATAGIDLAKAWERGDASPENAGKMEARMRGMEAILKTDTAVPDAVLSLVAADPAREARIAALASGPEKDRAFKEFASTPLGDLEVLGGISVADHPIGGQAVCHMVPRTISMGTTSVTGDFRHELGHAIRASLGGKDGVHGKNDITALIADLHKKSMKKAGEAKAQGLVPSEYHGEAAQDWFAENYGVIDMRSLDNWEEDFAEHYRAYQKAVYQTLNPSAPGGDAHRLERYRDLFPEWAKMWDAWYTGQLLSVGTPAPAAAPKAKKTEKAAPSPPPFEIPPSFEIPPPSASPTSTTPPWSWVPPEAGKGVGDLGYAGGKPTPTPADKLGLTPGDFIEGNPGAAHGTRYIVIADPTNKVSGLAYVKMTEPDGKTPYTGTFQKFHFSPPSAAFKKLDGHFDLGGASGQKSPGFGGQRLGSRSGNAALDAALDDLEQGTIGIGRRDEITREIPVRDLRLKRFSKAQCGIVADQVTERLKEKGFKARSQVITIGGSDGHFPSFEDYGYGDTGLKPLTRKDPFGQPGDPSRAHEVTVVRVDGKSYVVDYTAKQYGYSQFPLVHELAAGQKSSGFKDVTPDVTKWEKVEKAEGMPFGGYRTFGERGTYQTRKLNKTWALELNGVSLGTAPTLARVKEMVARVDVSSSDGLGEMAAKFTLTGGPTFYELWGGSPAVM